MPIYEFYCPETNTVHSFLARSLAYHDKTPRCPTDPKHRMERMLSSFSVRARAKQETAGTAESPDDPLTERAMAEMEREFSGMDEENPDPRQLARMMQKVSELTGEKLPAHMAEMMQRLEKGEDPEKLEAEYGDSLDTPDPQDTVGSAEGESGAPRVRRRWAQQPQRDPKLYEITDYLD